MRQRLEIKCRVDGEPHGKAVFTVRGGYITVTSHDWPHLDFDQAVRLVNWLHETLDELQWRAEAGGLPLTGRATERGI